MRQKNFAFFTVRPVDLSFQILATPIVIARNEKKFFMVLVQGAGAPQLDLLHTHHEQPIGRLWKAVDGTAAR